jgi:endonuclease/exonuclease/phosphatase family metal-dependent hydrolase
MPHWFLPEISPFQERLGGRMALVSEVNVAGRKMVTYNLHLESKGDDALRCSQLDEVLGEAQRQGANTPILLSGDFNLDASFGPAAEAINRAGFRDAFAGRHSATTPASFFESGRVIDWILTRGFVEVSQPQVFRSVSASDHFPLLTTLVFV